MDDFFSIQGKIIDSSFSGLLENKSPIVCKFQILKSAPAVIYGKLVRVVCIGIAKFFYTSISQTWFFSWCY